MVVVPVRLICSPCSASMSSILLKKKRDKVNAARVLMGEGGGGLYILLAPNQPRLSAIRCRFRQPGHFINTTPALYACFENLLTARVWQTLHVNSICSCP